MWKSYFSLNIFDASSVLMYRNSRTGYDVLSPIVHTVNNRSPNYIYCILYDLEINLLQLLLLLSITFLTVYMYALVILTYI